LSHATNAQPTRIPIADFLANLRRIVSSDRLLTEPAATTVYQSDGLTAFRALPAAVVLVETKDEVVRTVRLCHEHGVSLVGGSPLHFSDRDLTD